MLKESGNYQYALKVSLCRFGRQIIHGTGYRFHQVEYLNLSNTAPPPGLGGGCTSRRRQQSGNGSTANKGLMSRAWKLGGMVVAMKVATVHQWWWATVSFLISCWYTLSWEKPAWIIEHFWPFIKPHSWPLVLIGSTSCGFTKRTYSLLIEIITMDETRWPYIISIRVSY